MEVTVTFIGNATTLISGGGVTLLTDPNFLHRGQHAYLGYGLVSKRLREPAIDIDELPPLEAVVLSHMHGDHWDRRATTELDHELPVLTTPDAAKRLAHRGFGSALGLSTWQTHNIVKGDTVVNVTSLPGRHAPAPIHRMLPPVMGSMLEFTSGRPDGCTSPETRCWSRNSTRSRCDSNRSTSASFTWAAPGCPQAGGCPSVSP